MLNQNNYSEQSEYKEQKEQPANDSSPQTQPKKTPSVRRIGTFTMGITLVLVGILLLVFLFHPFDPTPLLRFSPLLLVLLGVEILFQYFHNHGQNLRYDFWGTFCCCFIIFCSLIACAAYPFVEYGTTYWQVEQKISSEVYDQIYAKLPDSVSLESMDVGCELNYSVHTKPTASAEQLSSGDEIWMYAQLTEQPDLAQFTAQVRTLLDSIDYASYPNFSASFYAQYPQGEFHLNLKDRTAMRLSTAELEKLVKVEEETADDEYALSEQSEPTATEVTVGSSQSAS